MPMDDLYKALQMFKEGLSDYQTTQAVNDARQQLSALQQQETDKSKLLQHTAAIGQDLALRLTSAGTAPGRIQEAVSSLAPPASVTATNQFQGESQDKRQAFDKSEHQLNRESAERIAGVRNTGTEAKVAQRTQKIALDQAEKFYKVNQKQIEAIDKMETFKDLIDTNPSQIGIELSKSALLKAGGDDRISDKDLPRVQNDPSARKAVARRLNLELTGEALKDDRKFYSALLDSVTQFSKKQLDKKVKGHASSVGQLYKDIDSNTLESAVRSRIPSLASGSAAPSADVQAALDWLSSDEGIKADAQTRQAVATKIKQLQGGK